MTQTRRSALARSLQWVMTLPLIALVLAACSESNQTGPLETPVLVRVEEPVGTGWGPVTLAGPPANVTTKAPVMPVRSVRVVFTGPLGNYEPSVQTLSGSTVISIPKGRASAAADGSHYEIASVDANTSPPTHTMFVQLPSDLEDPLNFFLRVVSRSQSSNRTDSAPLVIEVTRRPVYTVSVTVVGDGRVTSNPPGITCGTSPAGQPLTDCMFNFGAPVTVQLMPGSGTTPFRSWGGDCPASNQVCALGLTGTALSATANFTGATLPAPAGNCPTPALVPGWTFRGPPLCAAQPPGQTRTCDGAGQFCCYSETGANSARCGGAGKAEARATCRGVGTNALLIQPWGCYDSGP